MTMKNQRLETGQAWAIDGADGAPPLLVVIHTLEDLDRVGTVAGVSIEPHPKAKELGWPSVSHLPISAAHLEVEEGRLALDNQPTPPDFWEGYNIWLEKFREAEAGVFTWSARQAYKAVVGIVEEVEND